MSNELEMMRHVDAAITYAPRAELSVEELVAQVAKIQNVMSAVMRDNEHYGKIPGTPKPTLLKAGAEKLCLLFRLDPQYDSVETWDGAHLSIKSKCTLYHIASGERRGSGEGSCSTKETKYAYRQGKRVCPECGSEAIIKGQAKYGGGWVCWKQKSGCGAKFMDNDPKILDQNVDRVANPDLPDSYNTVLKMANKRALVAAVLNATAASDIFTQDVEDLPQFAPKPEPFRPTEEQLRRAREDDAPEPRSPKPADLEEGFGAEDMGYPVLLAKQIKDVAAACRFRAKEKSLKADLIWNAVLEFWDVTKAEHLPAADYEKILRFVGLYPDVPEENA